jgi:hypothetical protein
MKWKNFAKIFNNQHGKNTPETKRRLKGNNYPKEILELISGERKARKKWHQTRAPQDETWSE